MRILSVAVLAMLVAACGGDSGPAPIQAEGSWTGPVKNNSGATIGTLSLTLIETSGTVSGSGNIAGSTVATALTVAGTYTEPSLSLILSSQRFNDINLGGTVSETEIVGSLNGSGFVQSNITLTRQ